MNQLSPGLLPKSLGIPHCFWSQITGSSTCAWSSLGVWKIPLSFFSIIFLSTHLSLNTIYLSRLDLLHLFNRLLKPNVQNRTLFFFIFIVNTITNVHIPHPYPPPLSPWPPSLLPSLHCCPCLWIMHVCSLANIFTFLHPIPPPPPIWQLSVWSMCPCLCFSFVH